MKQGFSGSAGNKGAVLIRFNIDDSSFCVVNAHLASGVKDNKTRLEQITDIFKQGFKRDVKYWDVRENLLRISAFWIMILYTWWEIWISELRGLIIKWSESSLLRASLIFSARVISCCLHRKSILCFLSWKKGSLNFRLLTNMTDFQTLMTRVRNRECRPGVTEYYITEGARLSCSAIRRKRRTSQTTDLSVLHFRWPWLNKIKSGRKKSENRYSNHSEVRAKYSRYWRKKKRKQVSSDIFHLTKVGRYLEDRSIPGARKHPLRGLSLAEVKSRRK